MWRTQDVFAGKYKGCDIYLSKASHDINAYVQDNAERVILYCNVIVSCKEKGVIQIVDSYSQI